MSDRDCRLCKVVQTPIGERAIHDTVLLETDAFEWIPGIGAIVEGYSLIVSKHHVPNTGHLNDSAIAELDRFAGEVKRILKEVYSVGTIVFEHGTAGSRRKAGCCIEHQHLHLLPCDLATIPVQLKRILPVPIAIDSFFELKPYQAEGKPFIYYETTEGQGFVFDAPNDLPSQFMRQVLSIELGCATQWEWGQNPFSDRVAAFVEKAKQHILSNSGLR